VQSEFKSVRTFTKVSLLISVTTQQCLDGLADGDLWKSSSIGNIKKVLVTEFSGVSYFI
jgi:hypothetical protein